MLSAMPLPGVEYPLTHLCSVVPFVISLRFFFFFQPYHLVATCLSSLMLLIRTFLKLLDCFLSRQIRPGLVNTH